MTCASVPALHYKYTSVCIDINTKVTVPVYPWGPCPPGLPLSPNGPGGPARPSSPLTPWIPGGPVNPVEPWIPSLPAMPHCIYYMFARS